MTNETAASEFFDKILRHIKHYHNSFDKWSNSNIKEMSIKEEDNVLNAHISFEMTIFNDIVVDENNEPTSIIPFDIVVPYAIDPSNNLCPLVIMNLVQNHLVLSWK
jgi:hypothetical protein